MTETRNDLVKRAREALEGLDDGPWCIYDEPDVGLEPAIFSGVLGTDDFLPINPFGYAFMRFVVAAHTLVPVMADRIEKLEAELAAAQDQLRKLGETI